MDTAELPDLPKLTELPTSLPADGSISMMLVQGVPAFRASTAVVRRVEEIVEKERETGLNHAETNELARYEEIDDYLGCLNRIVRNLQDS